MARLDDGLRDGECPTGGDVSGVESEDFPELDYSVVYKPGLSQSETMIEAVLGYVWPQGYCECSFPDSAGRVFAFIAGNGSAVCFVRPLGSASH